jgi:endo-1,4-beta-xylanase
MKVIGHTLCWHGQSPAWLFRGQERKPLPRDEALRNLKDHIDAVAGHFNGKVVGWDVVNESIGDDYITQAFEFARGRPPRRAVLQRLRQ